MAKIKYSALVSGMRNKLNGSVASRNRYGDFWRNKTSPINAQTSYQVEQRSIFSSLSSGWKSLTQAQRDAWNSASKNFPFTDVFGDVMELSGNALYIKLNQNLTNAGESTISNPPTPVSVPALEGVAVAFDSETSAYTFTWTNTVTGSYDLMVYAAGNISVGRTFVKNFYKFVGTSSTLTSPLTITTMLSDRYGTLTSGTNLWVKVLLVSTTSGQQGLPAQASITVS